MSEQPRKPRICGVMSASGPNREMLACAYKPRHAGPHSWATLPTFPLSRRFVVDQVAHLMMQRYGRFVDFPAEARTTLAWLLDTFVAESPYAFGPGMVELDRVDDQP